MIRFVLPLLILVSSVALAEDTETAIKTVLERQIGCWNAGDLDGFMEDYWESPELTFSSGGMVRRGIEATRDRYKKSYPDRKTMGRTTFSDLEVTPLGDEAAMVLGKWRLDRDEEPIGGVFTLVFRKIDGRWVIIHDHTSKSPEPPTPATN